MIGDSIWKMVLGAVVACLVLWALLVLVGVLTGNVNLAPPCGFRRECETKLISTVQCQYNPAIKGTQCSPHLVPYSTCKDVPDPDAGPCPTEVVP